MKKIIHTDKAPKAIGPYSQATEINGMVFLSGQIALDPETGTFVNGDIREQTEQVLKNVGQILKEAGLDYNHVVKTTCFLTDLSYFKEMNEVYARYYPTNSPARSTIAVKALPMGALVEIETIAIKA